MQKLLSGERPCSKAMGWTLDFPDMHLWPNNEMSFLSQIQSHCERVYRKFDEKGCSGSPEREIPRSGCLWITGGLGHGAEGVRGKST